MIDDIRLDYMSSLRSEGTPSACRIVLRFFRHAGFRAAVLYRLGHRHYVKRRRLRASLWRRILHAWTGCDLSTDAEIGPGLNIPHPSGVVIGNKVRIGCRAYILQGVTLGGRAGACDKDGRTQPWLGDDVLVGAGAKLLGPVHIGDNVDIGANAVVVHDIPSNSTAVGIPARPIRKDGKGIPLLDQSGELADVLRHLDARISAIEAAMDLHGRPPSEQGCTEES